LEIAISTFGSGLNSGPDFLKIGGSIEGPISVIVRIFDQCYILKKLTLKELSTYQCEATVFDI
jgi:hypothetical protein